MGYLSDFSVSVVGHPERAAALVEALTAATSYEFYEISPGVAFVGDVKWYDFQDDVAVVSRGFPGLLVEVERVGEDHPDLVRQRFRDGVAGLECRAVLTWPGLSGPEGVAAAREP